MRSSLLEIYLSCAILMIIGCSHLSNGKVYERCELARLFRDKYALPPEEIGNWICIAKHHSGLNSSAIKGTPSKSAHGLFQISDEYWCSPPGHGFGCHIACDKLRDDSFSDDLECLKIIREEHKLISGDGYNAWSSYQPHCKGQWKLYIKGCFFTDIISSWRNAGQQKTTTTKKATTVPWWKYSEVLRTKPTTVKTTLLPWWKRNDFQTEKPTIASWKNYGKHSKIDFEKPKTTRKAPASRSFWKHFDHTTVTPSPFSWKYQRSAGVSWLGQSKNSRTTRVPTTRTTTTPPTTTTQKPATTTFHWIYPDPLDIYKPGEVKSASSPSTQPSAESKGKVYDNCELAWELYNRHNVPFEQIAMWVCIAQHESNFNTSAVGHLNKDGSGDHGLFQISDEYWCSPPGNGYGCGLSCSKLKDSDITDDVECMRKIYDEHQQISGNGFSAWTVYDVFCKDRADSYIDGCFDYNYNALNAEDGREPSKRSTSSDVVDATGKIYAPCELADELRTKYAIPEDQIATWVCIAKHESNFNTAALTHTESEEITKHGLFQVRAKFWCSVADHKGKCHKACSDYENNDISDDVDCIKKIFDEQQSISGNGFHAWTVYRKFCEADASKHLNNCVPTSLVDDQRRTATNAHRRVKRSTGKVFTACELAEELRNKFGVAENQIARWVCRATYGSNFISSAVGVGPEVHGQHGLFQISDKLWCSVARKGKKCREVCSDFEDDDISDNLECVKLIFDEYQNTLGAGFAGCSVYDAICSGDVSHFIGDCGRTVTESPKNKTGKVYKSCELAQELRERHIMPVEQIATWVCIASKESNLNTSRTTRLDGGAMDHGIFAINDRYWCDTGKRGKACNEECSGFEDDDITNDVKCIRRIFAEHQRLNGDGFRAWSAYRSCQQNVSQYIKDCFEDFNSIPSYKPKVQEEKKIAPKTNKVYKSCELAQELRGYGAPMDQVATWVCIAMFESNFSTSAVNDNNLSESENHGIFQINDENWCDINGPYKLCEKKCSDFEDDDIEDDFLCAQKIFNNSKNEKGNGFKAWNKYESRCRDNVDYIVKGCFANDSTKPSQPTQKPRGKVYEACELAKELETKHGIPMDDIATWVCIMKHESNFNTSKTVPSGSPGGGHGIFSIHDQYWCNLDEEEKSCKVKCSDLEDNDISDDVSCAKAIFDEYQRTNGNGFTAWTLYPTHCRDNVSHYIDGCFGDEIEPAKLVVKKTGKIYERCELARELKADHGIPAEDIASWICLVQHHTQFNTSAKILSDADYNSTHHGLFFISEKFWCGIDGPGKDCNVTCSDLGDDDITDDVRCAKIIFEKHQKWQSSGFYAWPQYPIRCKGDIDEYIEGCFDNATEDPARKEVGKVYEACDLAEELETKHGIPVEDIPTWICIMTHETNLNTSLVHSVNPDGSGNHGIFHISDAHWCGLDAPGKGCNVKCSDLENEDITDDVRCAKAIHASHGFDVWAKYHSHCKGNVADYVKGCKTVLSVLGRRRKRSIGKVYSACELAEELRLKHKMPLEQIATWVCIAHQESNFRTSAVGRLNADGSEDHGIFQISDIYWCDVNGPGKACKVACSDLEDDDLTDDVQCVKQIYQEHERIFGDGFHAWAVYEPYCKHHPEKYVEKCQYGITNYHTKTKLPKISKKRTGKVYTPCELAKELKTKHRIPVEQIPTWVCIAKHESNFKTSAVGRLNADGSGDHGLFQISDLYWCDIGQRGKACNKECSEFEDDDISDDVVCVKTIFDEHQRLFGDGFHAWAVYEPYCRGNVKKYIEKCSDLGAESTSLIDLSNEIVPLKRKKSKTRKIYSSCELARELRTDHNVPMDQIATWVCIAERQSNFKTFISGATGEHGIFQISEAFWCEEGRPGKACNIDCSELEDDDITDDVQCARMIYEEHQKLSGDGFTAWTVYNAHCKGRDGSYISKCFDGTKSEVTHKSKPSSITKKSKKTGKVYTACELAKELRRNNVPSSQIATWVCIAENQSGLKASASTVTGELGIFQISATYWCENGFPGKGCNIDCSDLTDDNLADDIECIKTIYEEHQRLSGNGFNAWGAYNAHCKGGAESYIHDCFSSNDPAITHHTTKISHSKPKSGKTYSACELAKELHGKGVPADQIPTWICIAEHQSNYVTSAATTTGEHGIFQISETYWCEKGYAGKACNVACSDLEDDDISDDIQCAQMIYEEHQRLSGNGFNAWGAYSAYCKGSVESYVKNCHFDKNELSSLHHTTKTSKKPNSKVKSGKVYTACELARELQSRHKVPPAQIPTWVCIAEHHSQFQTSLAKVTGEHGIFQISDVYWCEKDRAGKACNMICSDLEDDDIEDDIQCAMTIYDEHQRLSGNGFHAWAAYNTFCQSYSHSAIEGCFSKGDATSGHRTTDVARKDGKKKSKGKIYSACELALELLNVHKLPQNQIATWVCIASHESNFKTSAVGRLNADGSGDHGLFQISDIYWCDTNQRGKACNKHCGEFEDSDIADDVECVRRIYDEHERIYGDGFHAWTVYNNGHCKKNVDKYIKGCFSSSNVENPAVPTEVKPKKKTKKIYSACELAQELKERHGVPQEQIATWVCIAKHESDFSTSAVGRLNWDGSGDHGIFQISDLYWCDVNKQGKACNKRCSQFEDDDIADDVECVRKIYDEHERIYGDGFHAWTVYNNGHCKKNVEKYIKNCFDTSVTSIIPAEVKPKKKTKKIYSACELAQELKEKHRIPEEQIATWVCIAKHESDFSTSAVGKLNLDGSGDHGIFQISDIYWCDLKSRGKACNKKCSEFEDDDITDDVECIRKIYEEHERLFGNGFNAWTVYDRHCKGDVSKYIQGCFRHTDNKPHMEKPSKSTIPQPRLPPGKVYDPCELALELKMKHQIHQDHLATWVCIAKHEANYDTAAIGYGDHGLFQISELFWCSKSEKGKECNAACSDFRDSDITDDVACIKKIYNEHQRLSGNGFNAWTVYPLFCKENTNKYIASCPQLNLGSQSEKKGTMPKTTDATSKPFETERKTTARPKTTSARPKSSSPATAIPHSSTTTSKNNIYSKAPSVAFVPATESQSQKATTTSKPKTTTTTWTWQKPQTTISTKPTTRTTQWSWKRSQTTTKSTSAGQWAETPSKSTSRSSPTSTKSPTALNQSTTVKTTQSTGTNKQTSKKTQAWSWKPPKSTTKPASTTVGHSTATAKTFKSESTTPTVGRSTATPHTWSWSSSKSTTKGVTSPTKSAPDGHSATAIKPTVSKSITSTVRKTTTTPKTWSWNPTKSTTKITSAPTKSMGTSSHSNISTKTSQTTTARTKKIPPTTKSWTWKPPNSPQKTTVAAGRPTTKRMVEATTTPRAYSTSTGAKSATKPKPTTTPRSWSWRPPKQSTKGGSSSTEPTVIGFSQPTSSPKTTSVKTRTTSKSVSNDPFAIYLTKGQSHKSSSTPYAAPTPTPKIEHTIQRTTTTRKHQVTTMKPSSIRSSSKSEIQTVSTPNIFDGYFSTFNSPQSSTPAIQKPGISTSINAKPTKNIKTIEASKPSTVRFAVTSPKPLSTISHKSALTTPKTSKSTTKTSTTVRLNPHRTTTATTTRHHNLTSRKTMAARTTQQTTTASPKSVFTTTTQHAKGVVFRNDGTNKTNPTSKETPGSWNDRKVTSRIRTTKQPATTLSLKTDSTTSQHVPTPTPTSFRQSILDFFFS